MSDSAALHVLALYPGECRPRRIEPLGGAGGFSGAEIWRVEAAAGLLCLRRWPREHPSPEHLRFIHDVLAHAAVHGFRLVPVPRRTLAGGTCVSFGGHLWELAPWMPGEPTFHREASVAKLNAATAALARFHLATADFPRMGPMTGPSPGLARRRQELAGWLDRRMAELEGALNDMPSSALTERIGRVTALVANLGHAVLAELDRAGSIGTPLQPCLRDIWHDHVLFTGNEVTGFVDFGAMQVDAVAGDLARLLGTMAADDRALWAAGLESYAALRPLSIGELALLTAFDASGVVLSGLNWGRWICLEGRQFNDPPAVAARLDGILERLAYRMRTEA